MLRDTFPVGSITEEKTSPTVLQPVGGAIPLTNDQWKRGPCFSCGLQGHGVPHLLPGWSVDVPISGFTDTRRWTGQSVGKRGWFGREGQPPGPSMIMTHLTQGGGGGACSWGTPPGLATTEGWYPRSSMDPECPGLSSIGEPYS